MVIHTSKEFAKRFRCQLSLRGQPTVQAGSLDAWSAHFFRLGTTPLVLMMNDATLWSIIIPAKGITTLEVLLKVFLARVAELWLSHKAPFDPNNQSLLFLSRSNRSLIGTMNDAINFIRLAARDEGKSIVWPQIEQELGRTPYSALNYDSPDRVLKRLLTGKE